MARGFIFPCSSQELSLKQPWFQKCPAEEWGSPQGYPSSTEVLGCAPIRLTQEERSELPSPSDDYRKNFKEKQGLVILQKHCISSQWDVFCQGELEKAQMLYNSPAEISLSCLLFSGVMYFSVILKMNGLYFSSPPMHHSVSAWSESLCATGWLLFPGIECTVENNYASQ